MVDVKKNEVYISDYYYAVAYVKWLYLVSNNDNIILITKSCLKPLIKKLLRFLNVHI